jgi:hypothetical protein
MTMEERYSGKNIFICLKCLTKGLFNMFPDAENRKAIIDVATKTIIAEGLTNQKI